MPNATPGFNLWPCDLAICLHWALTSRQPGENVEPWMMLTLASQTHITRYPQKMKICIKNREWLSNSPAKRLSRRISTVVFSDSFLFHHRLSLSSRMSIIFALSIFPCRYTVSGHSARTRGPSLNSPWDRAPPLVYIQSKSLPSVKHKTGVSLTKS